jgi:hypothetical protein
LDYRTPLEVLEVGGDENLAKLRRTFNINSPIWRKKKVKGAPRRKARIDLRNKLSNDVLITIEECPSHLNNRFKISMNSGAHLTLKDFDVMREAIRVAIKEMEV